MAELIQALGRARGVNRTADNPVTIDILANVCLPVTVQEVLTWKELAAGLGGWSETAAEGVLLTSRTDAVKAFPEIWRNLDAAKRDAPGEVRGISLYNTLYKGFCPSPPSPLACCSYQPAGAGQRLRTAYFDLGLIPDPKSWLAERLGPLASFEFATLDGLFDAAPRPAEPRQPSRFTCAEGAFPRPCEHRSARFLEHCGVLV